MKYVDYHVHSSLSPDSNEPMEAIIISAINKGIDELCFTEHLDYFHPTLGNFAVDLNKYKENFDFYKKKYRNKINLKFGIEVGYQSKAKSKLETVLKENKFDFIINSTHIVEGKDLVEGDYFIVNSQEKAYEKYLQQTLNNIREFHDFDVLGHFDFITRYGDFKDKSLYYTNHCEIIDEILKKIINMNKGIEINTSGYSYGLDRTMPTLDIVSRYYELGGEIITISSDAHRKEDVGRNYLEAVALLDFVGFKYITTFKERKPSFFKIENMLDKKIV